MGECPAPSWLARAQVLSLFEATHARAQVAYRQFVADGIGGPSPWAAITGQIFFGSPVFRERMAALVPQAGFPNVPRAQTDPTRLRVGEILGRVAAVIARRHQEAYQTAV